MPKIMQSVPDQDKTITRVVGLDVIRHVCRETGIDQSRTAIYYPGQDNQAYQPGSSIGADSLENELKPDTFNQLSIEVEEDQDITFMNSTNVFSPENLFTFQDTDLDISIRPSYAVMNLNVVVQYRTRDKNGAYRWRDEIRQKISAGKMTYFHDISYSYFLPPQYWTILKALYDLREAQAGYGQTWEDYLAQYLTGNATIQVGLDGQNAVRVIRETQGRLLGWFDFEGQPEHGGRDGIGDTWTISFTYHLQYNKPTTSVMVYPIVIHNQLLDQQYRPDRPVYTPEQRMARYAMSTKAGLPFETDTPAIEMHQHMGLRIPNFDEFVVSPKIPHTLPVVTAAVLIDPTNPTYLMSFAEDLDTFVLDEDIAAFMKDEAPYLTEYGQSIFSLVVYEWNTPFIKNRLTIGSDLKVYLKAPADLRTPYHLVLAINQDIGGLSAAARARAQRHCKAFLKILACLNPQFANLAEADYCLPGDLFSTPDMEDVALISNRAVSSKLYNNEAYGFWMIEKLAILTSRNTDHAAA